MSREHMSPRASRAYDLGRKIHDAITDVERQLGHKIGEWRAYDLIMSGETGVSPEAYEWALANLDDPEFSAFFEAGRQGNAAPRYVTGWRYGDPPECGRSYNYRDQLFERGVSLMQLTSEPDEISPAARTFEMLNAEGRAKVHLGGWMVGRGSDGEPVIVGARVVAAP